jgi:lipoprotein-releasing system permease protein
MSKLPFELLMALRYLRPRRTFVSVITVISILGVMLGVAVLIIVISVMTGFDRQLRDRIVGFNAHLRIVAAGPMEDYRSVMEVVRRQPGVKGVAPYVLGQVLVKTQPEEGNPRVLAPVVRGIDPRLEGSVSVLPKSIVAGEYDVKGRGLLVGRSIADRLDVNVGDRVAVYSVRDFEEWEEGRKQNKEEAPLADDYVVRGVFDVGYHEYNDLFVVTSLANAQDMYRLDDSVHGLIVTLDDPDQANAARRELGPVLAGLGHADPGGFQISTWMEENSTILEALIVEKSVMYYLLFFIVLVAAFGITSALITFVVQKTREIGMLKALGGTRGQVVWLFLSQSLIVGVVGVICGFGLGMLAVSYRNEFLHFMRRATGFELFPAQIYNFSELPALIVPGDIAVICGGSLVICLLAGLLPAWNAGRLKPVEALRYE